MDAVFCAFVSGKGGTGKSTTAVYTAEALAAKGKRILLCELDFGLRCVDMIAGVGSEAVFDLGDVLSGRCSVEKALVQSPYQETLSLLVAPYGAAKLNFSAFELLCAGLKSYYDYILLDTAAGFGESFTAAAAVAQRIILVLTPDPVSLRDGRLAVEKLEILAPQTAPRLLLNRVPARESGRNNQNAILPDFDTAIDTVGAQLIGLVPESNSIRRGAALGQRLPHGSTEQRVFAAIASRILGENVPLIFR
jgi:septum site-determining protein MinD